jgi:hypothetical protein
MQSYTTMWPPASTDAKGLHPRPVRDPRVDVLRGIALLMIFVDHIPGDVVNLFTLHELGFCDAAEVFVLLAGFSSMAAYGRALHRNPFDGLRRIAARCVRIYLTQIVLLVGMLTLAWLWSTNDPTVAPVVAPFAALREQPIRRALTLQVMPAYLDILPLYIVLLGTFPLLWLVMRRSVGLALAGSGAVWALAYCWHGLNLPNATDPNGWYFNPFAWQFLFAIGAALAVVTRRNDGKLPRVRWLAVASALYLGFAFVQVLPWADWGPASLRGFVMSPPDKSHLSPWRIVDILAIIYLVMSSAGAARIARGAVAGAFALCGRHSLEVFAAGCLLALAARLAFGSFDPGSGMAGIGMQVVVNLLGAAGMLATAAVRERQRAGAREPVLPAYQAVAAVSD